ncbi:MAG: sensor histidine kinase, partial [Solirubrobacteraceae bacterium]
VLGSSYGPSTGGRGLVIAILLAACVLAFLAWTARPLDVQGVTIDLWAMALAGGFLAGAAPDTAASAFVFVAAVAAVVRVPLARALPVAAVGALTLAGSVLIYGGGTLGVLAYALGFTAAALGGSNARQSVARADQAEVLLAQTQRSHEEQLRAARLEESTRLAREIHDVLAHTLAGLTIQLEATGSLIEQGADPAVVLERVRRAHELAREGLRETRLAVGTLRGDPVAAPSGIEALVAEYRDASDAPARLALDVDPGLLAGPTGQAALRVVQEALTNVRKHAPGAAVSVSVSAGEEPLDGVVVRVENLAAPGEVAGGVGELAAAGGGYGLRGMRERAQALGGTLNAGPADDGWRVELRLPIARTETA